MPTDIENFTPEQKAAYDLGVKAGFLKCAKAARMTAGAVRLAGASSKIADTKTPGMVASTCEGLADAFEKAGKGEL